MHDNHIHIKYDPNKTTAANWKYDKQTLHNSLLNVYHINGQNNARQIWEQKGYEHATTEEKKIHET